MLRKCLESVNTDFMLLHGIYAIAWKVITNCMMPHVTRNAPNQVIHAKHDI